jgi:hypothetical protein
MVLSLRQFIAYNPPDLLTPCFQIMSAT